MRRTAVFVALVLAVCALAPAAPTGAGEPDFSPGAAGAGDPYFPLDGNGGYEVKHYDLDVTYDPASDALSGIATIWSKATQNLSTFNLDFEGLTVRSIFVNGRSSTWTRDGGELTVTPRRGIGRTTRFRTVVTYDGIPATLPDGSGFIHTDDGALVIGEPDVAATWFPVNDHPIDKASYRLDITVPTGVEAVSNGVLTGTQEQSGWTTYSWFAREPMASYLVTMAIGEYDVRAYSEGGLQFWDALDPDLFVSVGPQTGEQYAISQVANSTYKRLVRSITVPAGGAALSFAIARDTESDWDFAFVEAHTVGEDDWTTLPDLNGHTTQDTGNACPSWLDLHPFLAHYQTDNGDDTCTPSGDSGDWYAVSGASDGYEQWEIDLAPFAGRAIEVSISYASDTSVQGRGLFVDDVVVSTGEGTTSFEADGDPLDGWTVPGSPPDSEPNPNDWIVGTEADAPPTAGEIADGSFARQGEIIEFLADNFGPYPFSAAGGIVDDQDAVGFALENQTRPVYSKGFFGDPISGDSVVVHELAHQWYGNNLALERWQHIWLNEGFATYAEWLWSEREGLGTAQENFDSVYSIPADSGFWTLPIGDPGPDELFDGAVYYRGAMTLHQLRLAVGDDTFFRILRQWAKRQAGRTVTTDEFIALAERLSGQQLDDLFDTWLFTTTKPVLPGIAAATTGSVASKLRGWTSRR